LTRPNPDGSRRSSESRFRTFMTSLYNDLR